MMFMFFGAGAFPLVFVLSAGSFVILLAAFFVDADVLCFLAPVASFVKAACLNGEDVTTTADCALRLLDRTPCIFGGGDRVLQLNRMNEMREGVITRGFSAVQ